MKDSITKEVPKERDQAADKRKITTALSVACGYLPYLSGFAAIADVHVDARVNSACVFPSGRILISPVFIDAINVKELAFILAHELLHLDMDTVKRQENRNDAWLTNIAHDFIINDILCREFETIESPDRDDDSQGQNMKPPLGGLVWEKYKKDFNKEFPDTPWKPVSQYSLEELVTFLKPLHDKIKSCWDISKGNQAKIPQSKQPSTLGDLLAEAGIKPPEEENPKPEENTDHPKFDDLFRMGMDVFSEEAELELFPDANPVAIKQKIQNVRETVVRSYSERVIQSQLDKAMAITQRGTEAGNEFANYQLLKGAYQTPWEAALQRWFDAVAPGQRSWARPSRRGAFRTDVVLPGRTREGWTLHIILDTSGSMWDELSSALGAIDQFCQGAGVESVHILQCDTEVTFDEFVELGDLEHFQINGFGGSDMSPAMLKLAEDPSVEAVLVLTDGYIYYPEDPMPYETLWCITGEYTPDFLYGTVVNIHPTTVKNY